MCHLFLFKIIIFIYKIYYYKYIHDLRMDFTVLYNVLEKYGWPGVICIALLIGAFYLIRHVINNSTDKLGKTVAKINEELSSNISIVDNNVSKAIMDMNTNISNTITTQNGILLNGVQEANKTMLDYIIKGNVDKHNESISNRLASDEMIDDKLRDMVNMYQANRVAVIEFHNSKENLDGLSFVWYDIHYEKFNKGTQDIMMQVQNQPSSVLLPIIKRLRTAEYVLLTPDDLENIFDEGPVLYNQLKHIPDLKFLIYFGIYNDDNRLISLVALEWHKDIDTEFLTEHIPSMHSDAAYISSLINIKKQE